MRWEAGHEKRVGWACVVGAGHARLPQRRRGARPRGHGGPLPAGGSGAAGSGRAARGGAAWAHALDLPGAV